MGKELYARDVVPFGSYKGLTIDEVANTTIEGKEYLINIESHMMAQGMDLTFPEFHRTLKEYLKKPDMQILRDIMLWSSFPF